MRKPEQKVYDAIKKNAKKEAWLQRVENIVAEGMPDLYVADNHAEYWIELKAINRPKREKTRLLGSQGLRQSQVNWHIKANTKNIISYVLIRDDYNMIYLISGKHAAEMNQLNRAEFENKCIVVSKSWDIIFKNLFTSIKNK